MIHRCTLTGLDEATDLDRVLQLSRAYPFVEWGILYSPGRAGEDPRYPPYDWIRQALSRVPAGQVALHLCGSSVDGLLAGECLTTRLVERVVARQGRVQLNFDQSRAGYTRAQFETLLSRHPALTLIVQDNPNNAQIVRELLGLRGVDIVFDASGGQGLRPDNWPAPLDGVHYGYAGGLGPGLTPALKAIEKASGSVRCWIDMETRIRDDADRLCLATCARVLEEVSSHLRPSKGAA